VDGTPVDALPYFPGFKVGKNLFPILTTWLLGDVDSWSIRLFQARRLTATVFFCRFFQLSPGSFWFNSFVERDCTDQACFFVPPNFLSMNNPKKKTNIMSLNTLSKEKMLWHGGPCRHTGTCFFMLVFDLFELAGSCKSRCACGRGIWILLHNNACLTNESSILFRSYTFW
jgi:hypothetical protein